MTRRAGALGLAASLALAIAWPTSVARAEPSVWARARDPERARRAELESQAEELFAKYVELERNRLQRDGASLPKLYLEEAKKKLADAHAEASKDLAVRWHYGQILEQLGDVKGSIVVLETMANDRTPAAHRARVYASLAIDYAKAGRQKDEIKAYDEALKVETSLPERARLLANQAEARMTLGDVSTAVTGYRAALTQHISATTLWGLGVALDRTGDLEGAIDSIRLARTYDPNDRDISGPGWFFPVEQDRYWYAALGHWSRARFTDQGAVKAEELARAVQSFTEYVAIAPSDDAFVALAKVRLKQLEKERATFARGARSRAPATKPAPKPTKPAK